jgi:hypothetical protein
MKYASFKLASRAQVVVENTHQTVAVTSGISSLTTIVIAGDTDADLERVCRSSWLAQQDALVQSRRSAAVFEVVHDGKVWCVEAPREEVEAQECRPEWNKWEEEKGVMIKEKEEVGRKRRAI